MCLQAAVLSQAASASAFSAARARKPRSGQKSTLREIGVQVGSAGGEPTGPWAAANETRPLFKPRYDGAPTNPSGQGRSASPSRGQRRATADEGAEGEDWQEVGDWEPDPLINDPLGVIESNGSRAEACDCSTGDTEGGKRGAEGGKRADLLDQLDELLARSSAHVLFYATGGWEGGGGGGEQQLFRFPTSAIGTIEQRGGSTKSSSRPGTPSALTGPVRNSSPKAHRQQLKPIIHSSDPSPNLTLAPTSQPAIVRSAVGTGRGALGHCFRSQRPLLLAQAALDPTYESVVDLPSGASLLVVPLLPQQPVGIPAGLSSRPGSPAIGPMGLSTRPNSSAIGSRPGTAPVDSVLYLDVDGPERRGERIGERGEEKG
ncbi:hypothetical protein T492DRAFT_842753 [Pavlovales sp. CCMP2436]|nr:hypothetical protein T492DRAFT_842753 [Pavlovales sp. CCMP2436]